MKEAELYKHNVGLTFTWSTKACLNPAESVLPNRKNEDTQALEYILAKQDIQVLVDLSKESKEEIAVCTYFDDRAARC